MIDKHFPDPASPFLGEFLTRSPAETFAIAKRISETLHGGRKFLLEGELGSGKTVFAKGLAAGLGIDPADVTSPSFTLVNIHEGRLRFYHIDLYRLDAGSQKHLGLEEILADEKAVTAIEWAERLDVVPADAVVVEMTYVSESERKIRIGGASQ